MGDLSKRNQVSVKFYGDGYAKCTQCEKPKVTHYSGVCRGCRIKKGITDTRKHGAISK